MIVTPELVQASDSAPQVPTGEPGRSPAPGDWKREGTLKGPDEVGESVAAGYVHSIAEPQQ